MSTVPTNAYYVASNSGDDRDGIYFIDPSSSGSLRRVARCGRPSAIVRHPTLPLLYGVGRAEVEELYVWRCQTDGTLTLILSLPLAGEMACALAVQPGAAFIGHYLSGQVSRLSLDDRGIPGDQMSATLTGHGPDVTRQLSSHPHHVLVLRSGVLVVTDLGCDRAWLLDQEDLTLAGIIQLSAGSGPRHAVELWGGRLAFTGELDQTMMIATAEGRQSDTHSSTSQMGVARNYPSDIVWHSIGSTTGMIVVANRGLGSLTAYRVSAEAVTLVDEVDAGGPWPMNLALAGTELAVANRDSDCVSFFELSESLTPLTFRASAAVPCPVWVTEARLPGPMPLREGAVSQAVGDRALRTPR